MKAISLGLTWLLLAGVIQSHAREWTATDGRKLDATFVSAADGVVNVKRTSDGRQFTLPLTGLSEADQTWVKEELAKNAKPVEGPFASLLTVIGPCPKMTDFLSPCLVPRTSTPPSNTPSSSPCMDEAPIPKMAKLGAFSRSFAVPARYAKNPCIIFAPHGYQPFGGQGTAWNSEPGAKALALIEKLVKTLPIDKNRIYVVGFSMGGFGACHFAVTEPKRFAAVVAGAGCTGPESAPIFKRLPIWLHHAADDQTVEVKYSQQLAEALKRSDTMKYTEYPTGGHGIAGTIFNNDEVHDWIFKQTRE